MFVNERTVAENTRWSMMGDGVADNGLLDDAGGN